MTLPPVELLPNLHSLNYSYQQPEFLPLLLGPRLKRLDLCSRSCDDIILPSILPYVCSRSPHLTHLSVPMMPLILDLESAVVEAIASLSQLKEFSAPNSLLTPSVLSALSNLPCLESVQGKELTFEPGAAGAPSIIKDSCSAFPSLRTLVLRIPFACFICWLSICPLPSLTELHVGPVAVESAEDHSRLIKAVVEGCPKLECLFLLRVPPSINTDAETLTFDHLQWLVQGSSLRDLDISHMMPLRITPTDVVTPKGSSISRTSSPEPKPYVLSPP